MAIKTHRLPATTSRSRVALAAILAICVGAALLVSQPAALAGPSIGDDGRIIAHDLDDIEWAWDIEFKFDEGSGQHNRPEYGLMRVYSEDFPDKEIRYTTIECEVVGDVSFSHGVATFDGGHLKCPMPSLHQAFAGTSADVSAPTMVAVGAKFDRNGTGTAPLLHHPDLKFSVLGGSGETQFELWANGASTARSPEHSTGGGWQTALSTIEMSSSGNFEAWHTLAGHGTTGPSSNSAPNFENLGSDYFYVGYTTHGGSTFEGTLDHLFVDPGKFR